MSSDSPATKHDLKMAVDAIKELFVNELRHLQGDVDGNTQWRQEFIAEDGPWRKLHTRLEKLERLAWLFAGASALLSPVVVWAIIQIFESVRSP